MQMKWMSWLVVLTALTQPRHPRGQAAAAGGPWWPLMAGLEQAAGASSSKAGLNACRSTEQNAFNSSLDGNMAVTGTAPYHPV